MKSLYAFLLAGLLMAVSCTKNPEPDPIPDQSGQTQPAISNVNNPYAKKHVSFRGGTVTVKFDAELDWTASVKMDPELDEPWVEVMESTLSGTAKKGASVRLVFEKNGTSEERVAELWVAVQDQAPECIATLTQAASGTSVDAKINAALNNYMHDILKEDYLFKDAYNAQEIDLTVNFNEFLRMHLLSLGEENIEDGGYYRSSQSNSGDRFIYTNLTEIQVGTKAVQTSGLGFGPFLSTPLEEGSSNIGLATGFVRRGSPAEAAGLRRGDVIYAVNGSQITTANYNDLMTTLYVNPSGTYRFSFLRFEDNGRGGYDFNAYESGAVVASAYVYNPVLHASVMTDPDNASTKIGYLVYESFDLNSQEFLESAVNGFIEEGITDLILDLRFNAGGAVAQSRWLSGCIAGEANGKKTFVKVIYNDDKTENWTFDYGYTNETDPLGKPEDLGLDRLFVITSYNTASAAELVINSLKGIDFPVKMIGCNTEGKNVGMVVSETSYNGRRFQFSPVTFWVKNAKDWGDYGFGMKPDEYVNNDNTNFEDDADNAFPYSFSDWGNMDFNIALQWAYCDITGKPRWNTKDTEVLSLTSAVPMQAQQVVLENGRYGNLRFNNK